MYHPGQPVLVGPTVMVEFAFQFGQYGVKDRPRDLLRKGDGDPDLTAIDAHDDLLGSVVLVPIDPRPVVVRVRVVHVFGWFQIGWCHCTVTLFARFLGLSIERSSRSAMW